LASIASKIFLSVRIIGFASVELANLLFDFSYWLSSNVILPFCKN